MRTAQLDRLLTVCQPDPFAMAARMKAEREAEYAAIAREEADKVAAAMVAPITSAIDRLAADHRAWMETF